MPKHKSLLVGARWVTAGRERKCYHSQSHRVAKGDACLEVKEGMAWKGYCASCAKEMVAAGIRALHALQAS